MRLNVEECSYPGCDRIRISLEGSREWSYWFPRKHQKFEKHTEIVSCKKVLCSTHEEDISLVPGPDHQK